MPKGANKMKQRKYSATTALLVLVGLASASWVEAAGQRMVYNPVTGRTGPEVRQQTTTARQATPQPKREVRPAQFAEEIATPYTMGPDPYHPHVMSHGVDLGYDSYAGGCGDVLCGSGCGDCCANGPSARLYAGFEAVIVKPRFENNIAYTRVESDGVSNTSFTEREFDYDLEFSPRVYVGWRHSDGIGLRATWWHFDHTAGVAATNPPANGFGMIIPPAFADVDISSNVPTDSFAASTDLNAYTIDIEATKETQFQSWSLGVGFGFRYARVEQGYLARLSDAGNDPLGQIDYRQSIEGIGPTISAMAVRPITCQTAIFAKARGSLLYGDGESSLSAGEDLDLATPILTTHATNRDDLLSIAEIQVGLQWHSACYHVYQPFLTVAMEGQMWHGAGSATSEEGTLGFFGLNAGAGLQW